MELKEITDFYHVDFSKSELETQLQLLNCMEIKCSTQSPYSQSLSIPTDLTTFTSVPSNSSCQVCSAIASY